MRVIEINRNQIYWKKLIDFSKKCSWKPGKNLANRMELGDFKENEQIFVAMNDEDIAGFCVFEENGYIPPELDYHPFINLLFVDEKFRGQRISERLIDAALEYGRRLKLEKVYLKSEHRGLYEKYGFKKIAEFTPIVGLADQLFEKEL